MAANKPGKAEILAAFFDDGTYSPLFTDSAVSAVIKKCCKDLCLAAFSSNPI